MASSVRWENKNRREKAEKSLLRVRLAELKSCGLSTKVAKDVKARTERMSEPSSIKTKQKRAECTNAASDEVFFTQRSQPRSEKEKAKVLVLRTISKMLEENRLIRQRLSALNQTI